MRLTDHVALNFNNNVSTAAVFLDIEKAFDTTWHTGLLYKLSKLDSSVCSSSLALFFIRKFFVSVEGEMFTPRIMKARVPQGSILSPTLFNMYVNDTPQAIGVHLALFDDDTCLYATERKEGYVLRKLQRGLNSVDEWSKHWNIKINEDKTQAIYFSN
jgi:retron-type reverse transcriptase